jgi:hypothetical protein
MLWRPQQCPVRPHEGVVDLQWCLDNAVSYVVCHIPAMAFTITFHPDEDAQRAHDALAADGATWVASPVISPSMNYGASTPRFDSYFNSEVIER